MAMAAAPLPAAVRSCLDKLSPVVLDSVARRAPDAYTVKNGSAA
jgi:hypothetical protein